MNFGNFGDFEKFQKNSKAKDQNVRIRRSSGGGHLEAIPQVLEDPPIWVDRPHLVDLRWVDPPRVQTRACRAACRAAAAGIPITIRS